MEQELLPLPDCLSSPPIFSRVRVALFLVLYVVFCRSMFVLLSLFFPHCVLSLLLRFTTSNYSLGIFNQSFFLHLLCVVSYYHFDIFKLFFYIYYVLFLITTLISSSFFFTFTMCCFLLPL